MLFPASERAAADSGVVMGVVLLPLEVPISGGFTVPFIHLKPRKERGSGEGGGVVVVGVRVTKNGI